MQDALFHVPQECDGAAPSPGPVCKGKRFIELPARSQLSYETWCLDQLVPQDAPVRFLDAALDRLDFSALEAEYPGGGRPAHPPRLVCKLLIYGYSQGERSAREMARRIEKDLHFMWLAHGMRIDHEVLSDFRRRFGAQFQDIFVQTVRLAASIGMVRLGHIAIDGSKIAAHSRRRAMSKDNLDRAIAKVRKQIGELLEQAEDTDAAEDDEFGKSRGDQLPRDIASLQALHDKLGKALEQLQESDQKQVCVNDPDAPVQKTQDGKRPGYNAQIAVDDEEGVIVGQDVVPDQNDAAQFMPMAEQAVENLGMAPDEFAADSGYHSGQTLDGLAQAGLNATIGEKPSTVNGRFTHNDFRYDEDTDRYICPEGRALIFKGIKHLRDTEYRFYRAEHSCRSCPRRDQCIPATERYRQLLIGPHDPLISAMRTKLATEAGAAALQKRKETVECVFGTIKQQLGLRQFLLVGLDKVRSEFCLAAIAFNLRKIAGRLCQDGCVTPSQEAMMA